MKRMLSIAVMGVVLGIALIAVWFSQEDPSEIAAWRAEPPQPSVRPAPRRLGRRGQPMQSSARIKAKAKIAKAMARWVASR